ncbi:MAG: bifunctional UDP-3-O-[3-hydroxymyristoyl] N-acetylglucosamine deacetylase/3-hydroxyacyl-ACP dehydratase [Chitinophagales bacterium]|nr:bifunctional UDP-3-O-[3-hydroxymyristoyl] N-acetylglucosamine deacetylase/3-hydroxyacyl-ACP dehydratase [Chitinophagales bacterium]
MKVKNILKKEIEISGIGLHTGAFVNMRLLPSEEGNGIQFVRTDLNPPVVIKADVNFVHTTNRGTTLKVNETTISTIEHLLASVHALSIEDLTIEVDGPEIPILDGSAALFIQKFNEAGLEEKPSDKEHYIVTEPFTFVDPETGSEYAVFPSDHFELNTILNFPNEILGDMVAVMKDKGDFAENFAGARTFVFLSEIEKLFDAGLIKGGDIDNALVIIDKQLTEEAFEALKVKINKPNAVWQNGVISTTPMRFPNEPARHKLLDVMGDLMLLGREIQAKIIATRPGHTSNVALTKILRSKYLECRKNKGRPIYDPEKAPVMDIEEIKRYLPHRYPFLLVDKVIELSDTHIVGLKNITFNEQLFMGHFPDNPVFPGVLQIEALAQTGGLLALKSVSSGDEKWDTYFLKIENVKFKVKVEPGDTLLLKMELMAPIRRGIVQMRGTAYVGSKLVSEGELTAQIVKRSND